MNETKKEDYLYGIAEFELTLKMKGKQPDVKALHCSQDLADLCRLCFDDGKIEWVEEFIVIAANRANKVMGFYKISSGGMTGTVCDPRVIMQFALLSNACTLILAHNHPSGNLMPSQPDRSLTEKIKQACGYFDIKVLDHIIITADSYYSFSDNGYL